MDTTKILKLDAVGKKKDYIQFKSHSYNTQYEWLEGTRR